MIHSQLKFMLEGFVANQDRLVLADFIEENLNGQLADEIRNMTKECPEPKLTDLLPDDLWYKDNWENAKVAEFKKQAGSWCPHFRQHHDMDYGRSQPMYSKDGLRTYRCRECMKVFFQWDSYPLSLCYRVVASVLKQILKVGVGLQEDNVFGMWPSSSGIETLWKVSSPLNVWTERIGLLKYGSDLTTWYKIGTNKKLLADK